MFGGLRFPRCSTGNSTSRLPVQVVTVVISCTVGVRVPSVLHACSLICTLLFREQNFLLPAERARHNNNVEHYYTHKRHNGGLQNRRNSEFLAQCNHQATILCLFVCSLLFLDLPVDYRYPPCTCMNLRIKV